MRLLLINNYKESKKREEVLHNLERCVGQTVDVIDHDTRGLHEQVAKSDPDLVFLTGSSYLLTRPGTRERFQPEVELVQKAGFPILGICFGHQLIGTAFGAGMTDLGGMVKGFGQVEILDHHSLFDGLPMNIRVVESHRQVLDGVPMGFVRLAESETTHIEAMYHKSRPIYSFQFHPERADDSRPHGRRIIQNLLKIVKA